ncbi:integrase [Labrys miyagiensis]
MAKLKFTTAALTKHFGTPTGTRGILWDTEVRGLGAYGLGAGDCTLFVQYRLANGLQRKKTIGRLRELSLSDARMKALEYSMAARHGEDLVAVRKIMEKPKLTLADAYLAYDEALKRRNVSTNTLALNARNWKRFISKYGARDIAAITKQDARAWHTKWGDSGPTVANQCARLLRAIYNYAAKVADDLPANPCRAIEYFTERNLRRVVSKDELAEWWLALENIPNPIRRAYWKLLLFTGLRKQDAATMRWDEVFDDRVHRPNPKGGRTKAFDLPMTAQLRQILDEAKAAHDVLFPNSPYVFPSTAKCGHLVNPREEGSLPGCSPHDLRRTYATACVEAGVDPYVLKLLLNHAANKNDVTSRYVRISPEHKSKAAIAVASYISDLLSKRV